MPPLCRHCCGLRLPRFTRRASVALSSFLEWPAKRIADNTPRNRQFERDRHTVTYRQGAIAAGLHTAPPAANVTAGGPGWREPAQPRPWTWMACAPGSHTRHVRSGSGAARQSAAVRAVAPAIFLLGTPAAGAVENRHGSRNSPSNPQIEGHCRWDTRAAWELLRNEPIFRNGHASDHGAAWRAVGGHFRGLRSGVCQVTSSETSWCPR